MTVIRLCFIGDSITTGTGDPTMLGFPGRLCAAVAQAGHNVTLYNLGVRGDTSEDIYRRWRTEAQPRMLANMNNVLVFMLGLNDSMILDTGQPRVPLARTLAVGHSLMLEAKAYLPSLFIGPAPVDDTRCVPGLPPNVHYQFFNDKIGEVNSNLARIAKALDAPFLDVFSSLATDSEWRAMMRQGDGVHPSASGYKALADLISTWSPWRSLFFRLERIPNDPGNLHQMNFKAAVLTELGKPLSIQNVTFDTLAPTDALVKLRASGLCHTELEVMRGDIAVHAPMVMGHEGAGIVEAVGAGVTRVKPGDHVVCSWNPNCGHCFYCVRNQPILCETIGPQAGKGGMPDGTFRLALDGQLLHQFSYVASHAEYTVISEAGAIPIPREMPFDRASLLGCGVMTGVGGALNIARVKVGSSAVTLGCGIVGLSAIQGARLGGAEINIALDVNEDRLQLARRVGATHTINAAADDAIEQVRALTQKRGADYAFEAAGNPVTMQNALEMVRTGGTVVILGKVPFQNHVSFRFGSIFGEKIITRSSYGGARPLSDFPMLSRLYLQGDLLLDDLITERITLEGIPTAFEQMASGQILRAVVSL